MNKINIKTKILDSSSIIRRIVYLIHKKSALKNPKKEANRVYRQYFGKDIDWDNPKDLIEKIYWLQFNRDTTLWSLCADKYRVRQYVEEKGLGNMLPILYGKWDRVEDIDFNSLPNEFVIKANNGSGSVEIVRDKASLDITKLKRKMKEWLSYTYGYNSADLFYAKIPPCIIAEELHPIPKTVSATLIDYKIWCFNGEPECIWVAYNRIHGQAVRMALFDLNWNPLPEHLFSNEHYAYHSEDVLERPESLDQMLDACRILSEPFEEVRVDFYDVFGKPYFGELTFSSGYGFYTKEYYNYLGSLINL